MDSADCEKAGATTESAKGEQAPQPKRQKVEEVTVRYTLIKMVEEMVEGAWLSF